MISFSFNLLPVRTGYLKLDVYQLADVFESFRNIALEQDGLDPVNYYSVPGLTWDSAFKMTEAKIHLLQVCKPTYVYVYFTQC